MLPDRDSIEKDSIFKRGEYDPELWEQVEPIPHQAVVDWAIAKGLIGHESQISLSNKNISPQTKKDIAILLTTDFLSNICSKTLIAYLTTSGKPFLGLLIALSPVNFSHLFKRPYVQFRSLQEIEFYRKSDISPEHLIELEEYYGKLVTYSSVRYPPLPFIPTIDQFTGILLTAPRFGPTLLVYKAYELCHTSTGSHLEPHILTIVNHMMSLISRSSEQSKLNKSLN